MSTILIFFLLITLSGLFSAIEIAYFSLSEGRVRTMVRKRQRWAKLVEWLKKIPRKVMITVLIGSTLMNILAAALATEFALKVFGSNGVAIATGAVTLLVLVFGGIFPKTSAQFNSEKISRFTSPLLFVLIIILYPIIWILEKIMDIIPFTSGENSIEKIEPKLTEDEIKSLFQIGVEEGTIEEHEKEIAERLFRFNDTKVSWIMKPLSEVIMLDGDSSIKNILKTATESGYSRFIVYKGNRENIEGVVHIKDIITSISLGDDSKTVSSISKPPVFVSSEDNLNKVFNKITETRVHYILVKNNKKKIVGIVTFEDIIEELVGEVKDESEEQQEESQPNHE